MQAIIDSGNTAYNVIHGTNIKINNNTASFTTANNKPVKFKLTGKIQINVGAGHIEDRPLIKLDFKLHGKVYKNITFSVGNRESDPEKCLIGMQFLKKIRNSYIKLGVG